MATKDEIKTQLTANNVPFTQSASKAELVALLPASAAVEPSTQSASETPVAVPPPNSDRQARWEAALASLEKNQPAAFAARKASGEFDKIPDSFE